MIPNTPIKQSYRLIEVRCKKVVKKKYTNNPEAIRVCNTLLGKVKVGEGEIKCPNCNGMTYYTIERG